MAEKEYIEREALQRCRFIQDELGEWILAEDIINLPAADVVPVGAYNQAAWERDTAIEQLKQIGKSFGEKMDDVRPVVRAHWYWDEDGMDWGIGSWRCSECHARPETWWQGDSTNPRNKSGHYFCPNCGADMRETEDEKA